MDQSTTRRRNSTATSVGKLSLHVPSNRRHSSSFPYPSTAAPPPPLDMELLSMKPSLQAYTSLKDVLPAGAAVNSPTGAATPTAAHEISIRNRLVKQAAWAYLQPMAASPSYSGSDYFHRLRSQFSGGNPLAACLAFLNRYILPAVSWVFDRLLPSIGIQTNR